MAQWALGYVSASRGRRRRRSSISCRPSAFGRHAERLDLLLPAQWGLAEAALHAGDPDGAAALCDEALRPAREQGEWTFIAPFAVTGVRAHQAAGRPDAAARYLDQFKRAIGPGSGDRPSGDPACHGPRPAAEGSITAAREALRRAVAAWDARGRRWEASGRGWTWPPPTCARNRYAEAMSLVREVRAAATKIGQRSTAARADQIERVAKGRGEEVESWHPLTVREFEVAQKIAAGMTNAELADELSISPKTASAHVEHILAKLGVARRTEIAAWTSTIAGTSSPAAAGDARRR